MGWYQGAGRGPGIYPSKATMKEWTKDFRRDADNGDGDARYYLMSLANQNALPSSGKRGRGKADA